MPVYRESTDSYVIQQLGYGATGAASDVADFIDTSGFFGPTAPPALSDAALSDWLEWSQVDLVRIRSMTVTVASDVVAGSWTTDAGATTALYRRVDEVFANDTDYIRSSVSPASPDEVKLRLAPLADPDVSAGHALTIRYGKDGSRGDPLDLTITLYAADGTTAIRSETYAGIDTLTTVTIDLTDAEADAIPSADYAAGLVLGFRAVKQ